MGVQMKPYDYVLLIASGLFILFMAMVLPAYAEDCGSGCTGTGWTLYLDGDQLSWPAGELTKEQCAEMYAEIEPQTPPFSKLVCVEEEVKRESI